MLRNCDSCKNTIDTALKSRRESIPSRECISCYKAFCSHCWGIMVPPLAGRVQFSCRKCPILSTSHVRQFLGLSLECQENITNLNRFGETIPKDVLHRSVNEPWYPKDEAGLNTMKNLCRLIERRTAVERVVVTSCRISESNHWVVVVKGPRLKFTTFTCREPSLSTVRSLLRDYFRSSERNYRMFEVEGWTGEDIKSDSEWSCRKEGSSVFITLLNPPML